MVNHALRPAPVIALVTALAAVLAGTTGVGAAGPQSVPQSGPIRTIVEAILPKITLPPGFHIEVFAIVPGARQIAVSPTGKTVVVGAWRNPPHVVDATATTAERLVIPLAASRSYRVPNGVCFAPDGTLYLAEANAITAFPDIEAHRTEPAPPAKAIVANGALVPPAEIGGAHSARVCKVGPDNRLYVAVGQPYNVPPKSKQDRYRRLGLGGILRMDRDGKDREVFATGIRNSVGLDFNPTDGTLWFTDNQVDLMGDDIPPGEMNRADKPGLDFGFPWYGGGHTRTHEYAGDSPPADVVFPEAEMVAHAADLGLTFYRGTAFPPDYRGGIYSAQHGSWNRSVPVGARVMFTPIKPDGHAGEPRPFAEGWKTPSGGYLGRPVDLAELPDGSLLVSDDRNGALYRIWYAP
ncbi:MAG: PQQ-dependent sugar dehydrogenase [Ancalomicrobiaceae bacterium]|nr:PQQ-dependent sugar dehydrogenase [Ancalomicrobiaceae bacterium]